MGRIDQVPLISMKNYNGSEIQSQKGAKIRLTEEKTKVIVGGSSGEDRTRSTNEKSNFLKFDSSCFFKGLEMLGSGGTLL